MNMSNSTLIRICAAAAILAGVLRAVTSFLPETIPNVFLLYLIIDLSLFIGVIGLCRFAVASPTLPPVLGTVVMLGALTLLILRDLAIVASPSVYAIGAATFSVGLDLFAIHLLLNRKMPLWIPVAWLLSTITGTIGFFSPQLHFLFALSGLIFGIAFGVAGIVMWRQLAKVNQ
jgi:hypothetical protein